MSDPIKTERLRARAQDSEGKALELEDKLKERDIRIKKLEIENSKLRCEKELKLTEDDIILKILSYRAKGYTYKTIYDKLLFFQYDGDLEFIRYICLNVEELDNKFLLYYKEQVVSFEKSIKINPDLINTTLIQVLRQNIDDATQDLHVLTDIKEKSNIRSEITKHAKELTALTKNIADIKEESQLNSQVQKIKENLDNRNNRIVKNFDPSLFKRVK